MTQENKDNCEYREYGICKLVNRKCVFLTNHYKLFCLFYKELKS